LVVYLDRLDDLEVGVLACLRVMAACARTAGGAVRSRRFAYQGPGEMQRQRALPDSCRTTDEQRMRPAIPLAERFGGDRCEPGWQACAAARGSRAVDRIGHWTTLRAKALRGCFALGAAQRAHAIRSTSCSRSARTASTSRPA